MRLKLNLAIALLATSASTMAGARPAFIVGTGGGASPAQVRIYDADGLPLRTITPAVGVGGGVHVAAGDVNGDGVAEIVTGAGSGGGPRVKVFDGVTGGAFRDFFAYDAAFQGGVRVATGDLDGDGAADIVTGAGPGGGPHVKVFSGKDGAALASLFAFDAAFMGGVNVAVGDFGGDGRSDLIVGAGPGGGPHVRVLTGIDNTVQHEFFAFETSFLGGVSLATGRYQGLGALYVGAGEGGGGQVKVFSLSDGGLLASFAAFEPGFAGALSLGFAQVAGRDTLLVGTATRGGRLGLLDVGGRGRGAQSETDFSYLTPFGADYMDGLSVSGVAAPVPEPASWALMIAGFGLAGATARRRLRSDHRSVNPA